MGFFTWIGSGLSAFLIWLKSAYSDTDPKGNQIGSSSRLHIGMIIAFVIGVGVSFSIATHQKIITIEQFNSFLGSAGTFTVVTTGALYSLNQLGSWAKNKTNQENQTERNSDNQDSTNQKPGA